MNTNKLLQDLLREVYTLSNGHLYCNETSEAYVELGERASEWHCIDKEYYLLLYETYYLESYLITLYKENIACNK